MKRFSDNGNNSYIEARANDPKVRTENIASGDGAPCSKILAYATTRPAIVSGAATSVVGVKTTNAIRYKGSLFIPIILARRLVPDDSSWPIADGQYGSVYDLVATWISHQCNGKPGLLSQTSCFGECY